MMIEVQASRERLDQIEMVTAQNQIVTWLALQESVYWFWKHFHKIISRHDFLENSGFIRNYD